eukprot:3934442-Rhodomonas_salina.1
MSAPCQSMSDRCFRRPVPAPTDGPIRSWLHPIFAAARHSSYRSSGPPPTSVLEVITWIPAVHQQTSVSDGQMSSANAAILALAGHPRQRDLPEASHSA